LTDPHAGGDSSSEPVAGRMVGPFRILRPLGRGGMATVYLAADERHQRSVALKVLHPELSSVLGSTRFLREIEVAAKLTHPHILPLFESGEAGGLFYYTMPYVEGESLRDRLRRETQLPIDDALRVGREAAEALDYAHAQGIVHRDIKPENILLSGRPTGEAPGGWHVLVADFGIARIMDEAADRLTRTGMAVGTPAYMSPEQSAAARQVDGRADVYSLGCVMYEMLAGEPPYTGPTAQAIVVKRLTDPIPKVRRLRPTVPPGVDEAITKALATVPADRFGTATEFSRTLEQGLRARAPVGRGRRLAMAGAVVAAVAVFVALGWQRGRYSGNAGADPREIAVLPFESLGDSSDAYFTDGVANDVRAKLSRIPGLTVIARASSLQYRGTTKPPEQIARELGVDYLLTATVQWERGGDGQRRVRVTPELVDVRPGHAPLTRWNEQFDAALSGVFEVQASIAGQVAQALHVALGDSTKRELAARPTASLAAYDAYLRGEAASQRMTAFAPTSLRQAVAAYEQAVALDSTFVEAWARIAQAQATLYYNGEPSPAKAEAARQAAERARALGPHRPEAHQAMGLYYYNVLSDIPRALVEDSTALALAPNNADLLINVAWDELSLGRWGAARDHFELATRLDPRSGAPAGNLGFVLLCLREYDKAEQAYGRALELAPDNLQWRTFGAMVSLAQGDVRGARAILAAAPPQVDPTSLVAYVASYGDLMWVLDASQLSLLLRLTPSAFDGNRGVWALVRAQTYALRGDSAKARAYADSARTVFASQLQASPDNAELHVRMGLALGYLGKKREAIREGTRGVELLPISRSAADGAYLQHQLVRIYLLVGEPEQALAQLGPLLERGYILSPDWLRIDPTFAPLRGNPRFERLLE
jgi:eukaryotic-like serine/threonine-protein kinase